MMKDNNIWVCFTMDVERIEKYSPTGGAPNLEFSRKSMDSFCNALLKSGFHATFFIVPDAACDQKEFLREIAREGHELGMHFHDQSWKNHWKKPDSYDYLGGYIANIQRVKLLEAKKQWEDALGFSAKCIRPGNFSANDNTFLLLSKTGFTHGSISQPGRNFNNYKANWEGACRNVHRAHKAFRLIEGDLDFIEVPATTGSTINDKVGWGGFGDIRLEGTDIKTITAVIKNDIERQLNEGVKYKHLCFFTHNFANYWNDSSVSGSLRKMIDQLTTMLPEIAVEYGLNLKGATIGKVRETFLLAEKDRF
jgi:hypothetical protein